MRQQPSKKEPVSSVRGKPARGRYKLGQRAEKRTVRNLMRYNNLTEAQAQEVVQNNLPVPSVKRLPRERKLRLQEAASGGEVGRRRREAVVLLGVPLKPGDTVKLQHAVERTEDEQRAYEDELSLGSSEDELLATETHDAHAEIDSEAECGGLVDSFEHEIATFGDAQIAADIVESAELSDLVFLTREDVAEARIEQLSDDNGLVYDSRAESGMKPEPVSHYTDDDRNEHAADCVYMGADMWNCGAHPDDPRCGAVRGVNDDEP